MVIMAKLLGICLLEEVSLTNLQRSADAAAGFPSVWPSEVCQNSGTFWILLGSFIIYIYIYYIVRTKMCILQVKCRMTFSGENVVLSVDLY